MSLFLALFDKPGQLFFGFGSLGWHFVHNMYRLSSYLKPYRNRFMLAASRFAVNQDRSVPIRNRAAQVPDASISLTSILKFHPRQESLWDTSEIKQPCQFLYSQRPAIPLCDATHLTLIRSSVNKTLEKLYNKNPIPGQSKVFGFDISCLLAISVQIARITS